MNLYISTPINARREETFPEKLRAAQQRVEHLKQVIRADKRFSHFNTISHTNFDTVTSEAAAMGSCVRAVLEADAIYLDDGWTASKGCTLEFHAARIYGKQIYLPTRQTEKVTSKPL